MGMNVHEKIVMYSERFGTPNRELWLFTDDAHAHAALSQGAELGLYAANVPGQLLFETLNYEQLDRVKVNAGSPTSDGWFIGHENFALTKTWCSALSLETMLRKPDWHDRVLLRALKEFGGYQALFHPNDSIVTAVGAGGLQNPGLLFTTPDSLAALEAQMGQGQAFSRRTFNGGTLFDVAPRAGIDGFLLNVKGPGPTVILPLSACERARTI